VLGGQPRQRELLELQQASGGRLRGVKDWGQDDLMPQALKERVRRAARL
jgi:hypothetical protein